MKVFHPGHDMTKQHKQTNLSEPALIDLAGKLAASIDTGIIIYLEGQLGAGKTTFTRGFLRSLGYEDKVKSPTYTIVEPYTIANRMIYHFDLYRLQDAEELEEIGINEYFAPDTICLIEWPEKGFPLLPSSDLTCKISIKDNNRDVCIEANTPVGEAVLKKL